jgi:hypothetical protein
LAAARRAEDGMAGGRAWWRGVAVGALATACVTTPKPAFETTLTGGGEATAAGRSTWAEARAGRTARAGGGRAPARAQVAAWASLVREVTESFGDADAKRLATPFDGDKLAAPLVVLVGAGGGDDAFTCGPARLCFDAEALARQYGDAAATTARARVTRIFAHEYTHLLHRQWANAHGVKPTTPLQRALWEATYEGLGNLQSLGPEWIDAQGRLTDRARATLARLAPVLVDRLERLANAPEEASAELMAGLSSGPFAQKWGALPVALWLAEESGGDPERLASWVGMGWNAPIALAERHLGDNEIKMRLVALRAAL